MVWLFAYFSLCHRGTGLLDFLDDYGINVELTATERCGIQRYTFPEAKSAIILNLKKAMNWDATQDWNVTAVPLDKQKPDELKKQKPDEDKKKKTRDSQNANRSRRN